MNQILKPGKGTNLSNMLKNIQPETSAELIPYINRYMIENPNTGVYTVHDCHKPGDSYFHPSGDCDKCKRLLFFEKCGRYDNLLRGGFPVETLRAFKVGHAVHAMIQAWVEDMSGRPGFPVSPYGAEVTVVDEGLNAKGSIDDILLFPHQPLERVIEYKTINSRQFQTLKSPLSKHLLQVRMYLYLLDLPEGIILYIEKDYPHAMKEFVVKAAPIDSVAMRWMKVLECLMMDDVGPLEFECRAGSTEENRCSASQFCKTTVR